MRISDWSSDVCSSDLDAWYRLIAVLSPEDEPRIHRKYLELFICISIMKDLQSGDLFSTHSNDFDDYREHLVTWDEYGGELNRYCDITSLPKDGADFVAQLKSEMSTLAKQVDDSFPRSEEHTSELQSLIRIS